MQRFGDLTQHASTFIRMPHGTYPPHPFFPAPIPNLSSQYPHSFPTMSIAERLAGNVQHFTFKRKYMVESIFESLLVRISFKLHNYNII